MFRSRPSGERERGGGRDSGDCLQPGEGLEAVIFSMDTVMCSLSTLSTVEDPETDQSEGGDRRLFSESGL